MASASFFTFIFFFFHRGYTGPSPLPPGASGDFHIKE
jgi:hypothetical protein